MSQDGKLIMALLIVFFVSSSLSIVFGFLCGCFYQRGNKTPETAPEPPALEIRQSHNMQLKQHKREEIELELETNAAYGSVPPRVY